MNTKKLASLVFIAFISFVFFTGCSSNSTTNEPQNTQEFTTSELSTFTGRNGSRCLVAVNGNVYEIKNSSFWLNGVHTKSDGEAECGKDLSDSINNAPHGIAILTSSPKVTKVGELI